jgi:hypothetical protein
LNTFKEADKYGEEAKKNSTRDNYGRKTISPAPKVDKQSDTNESGRRRSGESIDETQFTK